MTETYILNTNDKARDRLALQHALYAQSSIQLLRNAGVVPGMKGLEIGCGSGGMTLELAGLIGATGQLLAIDLSQAQVNHVEKITSHLPGLRFKVWDVNNLTELNEQFDFIYCRMVLHHLANAHSAILQMKECLKPGGVIICEEPSLFDSTFCSPPSPAYERFTQWVRQCFIKNGRDFEIAHRLEQEFTAGGMQVSNHSLFQPVLRTAQQKRIYPMALDDVTPQLLHHNIASQDEIDALAKELSDLAQRTNTMTWIRMHQLVARC